MRGEKRRRRRGRDVCARSKERRAMIINALNVERKKNYAVKLLENTGRILAHIERYLEI